jgi:hypothetical protein
MIAFVALWVFLGLAVLLIIGWAVVQDRRAREVERLARLEATFHRHTPEPPSLTLLVGGRDDRPEFFDFEVAEQAVHA